MPVIIDIRERLRGADPVANEPALPPSDVAAMRREVLEAVEMPRPTALRWRRTLAIAAAAVLIAGAGIDTYRRGARPQIQPLPEGVPAASVPAGKTQLQFSTPGGTRIIWTLDPAFQLAEKR